MKILSNEQIVKTLQQDSKTKLQPSVDKEFSAVLKETVKYTPSASLEHLQTTFINPLPGLQPASSSLSNCQFAADSIEDMINLLDRYRKKLADPHINMKQIDPFIQEMTREIGNLASLLESLPADDGLRNILNHTLVTASLEISKFYRGDYISA